MIIQTDKDINSLSEYNNIRRNLMELTSSGRAEYVVDSGLTHSQNELHVLQFDEGYILRVTFDNSFKRGLMTFLGLEDTLEAVKRELHSITKQESN